MKKGKVMEKILDIIEAMAHEKNIAKESAVEAFKDAVVMTAKRLTTRESTFEVTIDEDTRTYTIDKVITVVKDNDRRVEEEADSFMSLSEAADYGDDIEVGDQIRSEIVLEDYGRTAAANLYRELEYHIQRRVEQDMFEKYKSKVGTIIIGTVSRVDDESNTFVEVGELKGIMSQRNRIKGESFKRGDTIKALLRFVSIDPEFGMFLELTRTAPKFLEELMKKEVPEIQDGLVDIISTSRIPGERAKIALKTDQLNIDPIGAAVGQRGVRINAVSGELDDENIDCIEYTTIAELFVSRTMSPAIISHVEIIKNEEGENEKAIITLPADQKSKAIGKSGINIRLASMLTGMQIELIENDAVTTNEEGEIEEQKESVDALEALFR